MSNFCFIKVYSFCVIFSFIHSFMLNLFVFFFLFSHLFPTFCHHPSPFTTCCVWCPLLAPQRPTTGFMSRLQAWRMGAAAVWAGPQPLQPLWGAGSKATHRPGRHWNWYRHAERRPQRSSCISASSSLWALMRLPQARYVPDLLRNMPLPRPHTPRPLFCESPPSKCSIFAFLLKLSWTFCI